MNKKSVYFGVQIIWSAILSAILWFLTAKTAFVITDKNDAWLLSVIIFAGLGIYLALTVAYIILGYRKISNWRPWVIIVSVFIAVAVGFLGTFGINVIEFLNRKPDPAAAVSIIGGADGPTFIFLAGRVGAPLIGIMVVGVILVLVGLILFKTKGKNDKDI